MTNSKLLRPDSRFTGLHESLKGWDVSLLMFFFFVCFVVVIVVVLHLF